MLFHQYERFLSNTLNYDNYKFTTKAAYLYNFNFLKKQINYIQHEDNVYN